MGNFFKRQTQSAQPVSERILLENKYSSSRYNLLLVVIFSLINVVIVAFGGDSYFLFSASVPYYIAMIGAIWCGKMPEEYYIGSGFTSEDFLDTSVLVICVVIAIIIIAFYLLFWILSKKKVGWLIASLVFFSLDTIFMFGMYGFSVDMILDILFHGWVIFSLASGIRAHYKLKALPEEIVIAPEETEQAVDNSDFNDGFEYPEDNNNGNGDFN